MFLLKSLKHANLQTSSIHVIFNALIISMILYALPSWGGFLTAQDIAHIDSMLAKCFKFGYCASVVRYSTLLNESDSSFFKKIRSSSHCLNGLLPPLKPSGHAGRPRGHPYALPQGQITLFKKSFLIRCLFNLA